MSLKIQRLQSLIEFAQESAKLRMPHVADVAIHKMFYEYEHQLIGLPGLKFNSGGEDDEIWLAVERLQETAPPIPKNSLLAQWIELTKSVTEKPALKSCIEVTPEKDSEETQVIFLVDLPEREKLEKQLNSYIDQYWEGWSTEEKKRRKTITLYRHLFRLQQEIEGSLTDTPTELVWGAGIAVWNSKGRHISYPIMTRCVEIHLNEKKGTLEIRPRDVDPCLEDDIYMDENNVGTAELAKFYKEFIAKSNQTYSPFDPLSFEPVLQSAAMNLSENGVYWPTQTQAEDRKLPKADSNLKVTDTWVLFARPKSRDAFIQDLERFKSELDNKDSESFIPKALSAMITEPKDYHEDVLLPSFRGISMMQEGSSSQQVQDLFFPAPFNQEQVRIVQTLENSDGVVVQGPPGTGKTHTIANIICHYLASGKRVLVSSMKDPALAVLRDKLPEEIKPLVISLLTNEQEGREQFEYAITKIASEIQDIDRNSLKTKIEQQENHIHELHSRLNRTDKQITDWAKKNLDAINLDEELIYPVIAANEIIQGEGNFEWLDDDLSINKSHKPQFEHSDIVALRESRRALGQDLKYIYAQLPEISSFPDAQELLRVHQDLSRHAEIQSLIKSGDIPNLVNSDASTIEMVSDILEVVKNLSEIRQEIEKNECFWANGLYTNLQQKKKGHLFDTFEILGQELEVVGGERNIYLSKPVKAPSEIELNDEIIDAVKNKADGKSLFGIAGIIGKGDLKKLIQDIKIINSAPQTQEDWAYVHNYLLFQRKLRDLVTRWNSLALELSVELFDSTLPHIAFQAHDRFLVYVKIKEQISLEKSLLKKVPKIIPSWQGIIELTQNKERLPELYKYLDHHLTASRLSIAWSTKEKLQKILVNFDGDISEAFKKFVNSVLGNPSIENIQMQSIWSELMSELRRIHALRGHFDNCKNVVGRIKSSGAVLWSGRLAKEPLLNTTDKLLPDNWNSAWRLRRLFNYISLLDGREDLKKLSKQRLDAELELSKLYQSIVVNRTWLKLAQNVTPNIKSALQSYKLAIAKIGKGTGKRAVRYRQDARNAATVANDAVPCWIMNHLKISESLPASFGCFDLVIIDEASQSDLTALPAILRAKKILVVGDDKQVSPDGIGMDENKLKVLMNRCLLNQVEIFRPQMDPQRSIYDLFNVVFSGSTIMLKEHFRCVGPIIEYSKREFYNHELLPVRIAKSSERLDPPLVDVFIEDGYRHADINLNEAIYIVEEIKKICADPKMSNKTIGVVSLLADKQSSKIYEMLEMEVGVETITKYKIECGNARSFQGKEKDIVFLSMVVSPDDCVAQTKDATRQRFNVAASRARDRMYLVRSVQLDDLSPKDELRRGLISHFNCPFSQDEKRVESLRDLCESPFELEMYDILTERGYKVIPQVKVGKYRIDMVVEGYNDKRLAIECDGDQYHGTDNWANDMQRQRTLERVGWRFWRCFASTFVMHKKDVIADLIQHMKELGIDPIGSDNASVSIHTEHRNVHVGKLFKKEESDTSNEDELDDQLVAI